MAGCRTQVINILFALEKVGEQDEALLTIDLAGMFWGRSVLKVMANDAVSYHDLANGADRVIRGDVRAEDDLREAHTIAQIDEDKTAMVAAELHPAHEADFAALVGHGQLGAGMGALPVAYLGNVLVVLLLEILNLVRHG